MKWFKLITVLLGGLIAVVIFLVVIGVPAQVLALSLSRQFEASTGLRLHVGGFAKLAVMPELGLTLEDIAVEEAASGRPVFAAKRVRYGIALGSLLKGQIRITDIAVTRSTLHLGQWGSRTARSPGTARPASEPGTRSENLAGTFALEQLTADDCTLVVNDGPDKAELRLDSVRLTSALSSSNDRLTIKLDAKSGTNLIQLNVTVGSPALLLEEKPAHVEAVIEASGGLQSTATIAANVQLSGPVLRMEAIDGTFDRGRLGGSVSVSFARDKPFVDANIDVERLDLTNFAPPARIPRASEPTAGSAGPAGPKPEAETAARWSDRTINFASMRMFEANTRIVAREIVLEKVHLGPATLEATLLEDKLSIVLPNSQLYGGQGKGELTVDASKQVPALSLRADLTGLNVLAILTDAADFTYVDGRGGARFDLKATGESPLRMVSSLEGTASALFENGELRGVNLPGMLQSLLETVLSGWQTRASERTKFSTFGASFRIKDGQARSEDLRFNGPFVRVTGSGTADLVGQTLDFRLEPKLVTSPGAQASGAESWSIGVQVLAKGPWSNPQIYADLPGILNNPAAALGKLRPGDKNLNIPGLSGGGANDLLKSLDGFMGGRGGGGGGLGEQLKRFQMPR